MINKRIIITGGTGYLGRFLIEKYYANNHITVFSRDESKQALLKMRFPSVKCVIGDVRNYDLMRRACDGHDVGIFCGGLKHVSFVNNNVEEAIEVIINAAIHAKRIAIELGMDAACFISTDKSRLPLTLYGAMKFIAGEQFIWNAERFSTRLSAIVCGNIINSTGSVIPLIWEAINKKQKMFLYSEKMTRFTITGEAAAEAVGVALGTTAHNVIPKLSSFYVKDLFAIYKAAFGLDYEVRQPHVGVEREHELMISSEDAVRCKSAGDYFLMHYANHLERPTLVNGEYNSVDYAMSQKELDGLLSKHDYFRPALAEKR